MSVRKTQATDFSKGKISRCIIDLAIPMTMAQLVNLLYNIVDRIYIGHIPGVGTSALTGVGLCMPILMLVNAFATLAGAGGAPRAAIAMGQGRKEDAEQIYRPRLHSHGCNAGLCPLQS